MYCWQSFFGLKVAMPIANKKKLACVPAVCIRVLVLIYYTQPLGTEGYRASVLYCYWYHAKKKN